MHYHALVLNESSTEDDMKKAYCKLDLRSHPEKNKYPQACAMMRIINKAKEGLEKLLRNNYAMRGNRKIFNFKKKLGENKNEFGNHKEKQKNKINKLKWTLV